MSTDQRSFENPRATTELPLPAHTAPRSARRTPRKVKHLLTTAGTTSSVANIIMQLALPPVGEGVSESRVVSGSPRRRPVKRARTTATYLALAIQGTEDDRAVMRRELGDHLVVARHVDRSDEVAHHAHPHPDVAKYQNSVADFQAIGMWCRTHSMP